MKLIATSIGLCGVLIAAADLAASPPNIVWINAEDMSPHLGCYGHPGAITPNIDKLASEGVLYRNAFATAPICSPSRSTLATGLYATSLGTQHLRCKIEIPDRVIPLATRLRQLGYYCTHFLPHLPYIQPGVIFDDRKSSFRELRRLYRAGRLNEHALRLWAPRKPDEELYDLRTDPHEINNLAESANHAERKTLLSAELRNWILEHRDSGLLSEAEYQIRAAHAGLTPLDVVQDPNRFNLLATLDAAWNAGDRSVTTSELVRGFNSDEAGVRYWSAVGMQIRAGQDDEDRPIDRDSFNGPLLAALDDPSPSVRIAAAEAIMELSDQEPSAVDEALRTLSEVLQDDRRWVALQAARALALQGERAKPLVAVMKQVVNKNRSQPGSRRPYKDFNYASFTGWALETALTACGEDEFVEAINE